MLDVSGFSVQCPTVKLLGLGSLCFLVLSVLALSGSVGLY